MSRPFIAIALSLSAILGASLIAGATRTTHPLESPPAPAGVAANVRFESVDVVIDPHAAPLAAYQFELKVDAGEALIVGVEGGAHAAFSAAPYYDPAALQSGRIIIGAFNTAADLPAEQTRIARVHFMVKGEVAPRYTVVLQTAATADGVKIDAAASVHPSGVSE